VSKQNLPPGQEEALLRERNFHFGVVIASCVPRLILSDAPQERDKDQEERERERERMQQKTKNEPKNGRKIKR